MFCLGKTYVFGGDHVAYQASRALLPSELFNKSGFLFQKYLLNPMAGYNENFLETSNKTTRKSIITAIEKLFRLPNWVGKVRWIFRKVAHSNVEKEENGNYMFSTPQKKIKPIKDDEADMEVRSATVYRNFPMIVDLSESSMALLYAVYPNPLPFSASTGSPIDPKKKRESKTAKKHTSAVKKPKQEKKDLPRVKIPNKANKSSRKKKERQESKTRQADGHEDDEDSEEEAEDGQSESSTIDWITCDHPSIGAKVAGYFQAGTKGQRKLFFGEVTKFAPPSFNLAEGGKANNDQFYHVCWEDGDEEDYDQQQYEEGLSLFAGEATWKKEEKDHESVGKKVAAYFNTSCNSKSRELTLFHGVVTKYSPAVYEDRRQKQYHQEKDASKKADETSSASSSVLRKERFHIIWEDDDEEDYTVEEYQAGVSLFTQLVNEEENDDQKQETTERESTSPVLKDSAIYSPSFSSSSSSLLPPALSTRSTVHPSCSTKKPVRYNYDHDESEEVQDKKDIVENGESNVGVLVIPKKQKNRPSSRKNNEKDERDTKKLEEEGWIFNHPAVTMKVADFFQIRKKSKLFIGEITRYLPESSEGAKDQLYHVVFEDGDEQDYSEDEYQEAVERFENRSNSEHVSKNKKNANVEVSETIDVERSFEEPAVSSDAKNDSPSISQLPTDNSALEVQVEGEPESVPMAIDDTFVLNHDSEMN
jgi:hypothetical protein